KKTKSALAKEIDLDVIGDNLFCKYCAVVIKAKESKHIKSNIIQHCNGKKHLENVKQQKSGNLQVQQSLITSNDVLNKKAATSNQFNEDLAEALIAANIPFSKLQNNTFRKFIEKWCKQTCPGESTLRKGYLENAFERTIKSIREITYGKQLFFIIDETTDENCNLVMNTLVGVLNGEFSKPMVLKTTYLDSANAENVA
ncbi:uncharacterized protein B4U79_13082, partial [Dinothrombium tinctorium]